VTGNQGRHAVLPAARAASALFASLTDALGPSDTEVEFYFLVGAVLFQAFAAHPATAHVSAMLKPSSVVRDAIEAVAAREGVGSDWAHGAVRRVLSDSGDPSAYLELDRVRVFTPLPEYVLAVKCAAMRLGEAFQEMDDIRYVLRAMNVTTAEAALSIVSDYFTDRQLPPETRARLDSLLSA